jgi:hypothetical protein
MNSADLAFNFYGTWAGSSTLENFLAGAPNSANYLRLLDDRLSANYTDLSKVPTKQFSERFSLLLNTFHVYLLRSNSETPASTLAQYGNATLPVRDFEVFAPRPPPTAVADWDGLNRFLGYANSAITRALVGGLPFIPASTTATASRRTPVYACSIGWMAALLVAAAALAATGAAALVLQLRCTLAPDMLRYVASMTYANPHFRAPAGGTALDGLERAKLLRNVRVRIGDVRGNDGDVGEVAFAAADGVEVRELEHKRQYA